MIIKLGALGRYAASVPPSPNASARRPRRD